MAESSLKLTTLGLVVPTLPSIVAKIDLATFSQPYFKECQIEAIHDIEAIQCWLKKYEDTLNTFAAYERQAKLFLMWCSYECGKTIGQLKVQDFENYFSFLKNPPVTWCASRASLRQGKASLNWRPLVRGLSPAAIQMAFRILKSLMGYLSDSEYVRSNPLKLIKLGQQYPHALEEQKYRVWARMLEEDEWQALQAVLNDLPEDTPLQIRVVA
jgi:site-specific recombinase XerD